MNPNYRIMGSYQGVTEELDSTSDIGEAFRLRDEFSKDFGTNWIVWVEEPVDVLADTPKVNNRLRFASKMMNNGFTNIVVTGYVPNGLEYYRASYNGRPIEISLYAYDQPDMLDILYLDTEAALYAGEIHCGVETDCVPYEAVNWDYLQ